MLQLDELLRAHPWLGGIPRKKCAKLAHGFKEWQSLARPASVDIGGMRNCHPSDFEGSSTFANSSQWLSDLAIGNLSPRYLEPGSTSTSHPLHYWVTRRAVATQHTASAQKGSSKFSKLCPTHAIQQRIVDFG